MSLLALDYDGVILDSFTEKLFLGFNAYLLVGGGSSLLGNGAGTKLNAARPRGSPSAGPGYGRAS